MKMTNDKANREKVGLDTGGVVMKEQWRK